MQKNEDFYLKKNYSSGFGLVDSIVSISLLGIVLSYSIYFVTKRMDLLFSSNIYRSINKEIKRDIDLLRSDMWAMGLDTTKKKYIIEQDSCIDISEKILRLPNWVGKELHGVTSPSGVIFIITVPAPQNASSLFFTCLPKSGASLPT